MYESQKDEVFFLGLDFCEFWQCVDDWNKGIVD